ncbi:MAG: YIP1 family protein [Aestuariivita sp.]|uniref:YIP1 family protein n=1 Tax=Aestuariivita sp. TaxID=1872407 RepID=UPI003BB0BE79
MPVTSDITATYRGPGRVMRRLLAMGAREDRALAFLMGFCVIAFIAQLPRLSREAHLQGQDLSMMMAGALMGSVFILPLVLYLIAGISHLVRRALGRASTGYSARLALFWSLLASTPILLLYGLIGGFLGQGPALQLVGVIWIVMFLWFWIASLRATGEGAE